MKLLELKDKVWKAWKLSNDASGVITQEATFVQDVKRFGDRRYKVTWIKALVQFTAQVSYESCLDAYMLVLDTFNFTTDRWDYEYRHEILDAFLTYPDGLDLIRTGLEQLYSSEFAPQEREDANGFFALVEERSQQPGRDCLPIRLDQRLPSSSPAT